MASVVLVITPISWILLHQPQNDDADASVPIVTRTDDTYITPTTKAAVATPTTRPTVAPTATPTGTPTVTPTTTPTGTPTGTPTDSASPTTVPSETPSTLEPTDSPTSEKATSAPTTPGRTTSTGRPTQTPTTTPPPPPPPARDGGMDADESQLFDMIDSARKNAGCQPLEQDPDLTGSARSDAGSRAKSGATNSSGSSKSTAGGDNWSAQQAYEQMMAQSRSTILNCGLTTLGVGRKGYAHCTAIDLLGLCIGSKPTRYAWVADFS
ncbi:CAP domain-containing protein [Kribbella jiaozuonensis]|nr:hypothetical protein [Kribbella jiaozuonensis]